MEQFIMYDEGEGSEEVVETTETAETPTETVETPDPKKARNEVLRDLSKELGVNLFEAEGMEQVKTLIESQKSEQQKLQEKLEAYENEKAQWETNKREYEAKLKASELGIKSEYLEDALKLANNEPDNLAEVIKKYPIFKQSGDVRIGVQDPNNNANPTGNTEVEAYLAERAKTDPAFRKYLKK